jgi:hypothetical protein
MSFMAARNGVRQVRALGFVTVTAGRRRVRLFSLTDQWRAINAEEAARRVMLTRQPQHASSPTPTPTAKPPQPVKPPKVSRAEQRARERAEQQPRQVPSMPRLSWLDAGR